MFPLEPQLQVIFNSLFLLADASTATANSEHTRVSRPHGPGWLPLIDLLLS